MQFDDIVYNDPNKSDVNRALLQEYSLYNRKAMKAIATEKTAHPYWTFLSSLASSFIPFGLGSFITPAANAGVQKGKKTAIEKINAYRAKLGLEQETSLPSSGLDLSGLGSAVGSGIKSGISASQDGSEGGSFQMPKLNLPKSDYWSNSGGGITGLTATTQNGYIQGPSTAEMRDGGKIEGPTHEQGGVELIKDGKRMGITVEGDERVVNKDDWGKLKKYLAKNNNKSALALLASIDKRKPKKENEDGANLTKFDTGELVNDVYNGARLGLGIEGAMTALPQYELPKEWADSMEKAKYYSEMGLTPNEKAIAIDENNANYAASVRDLANASDGNAGAYLGNLSNLNLGRMRLANQLATQDALLRRKSFGDYQTTLAKDIAYKKQIFDQQYNQALANKQSGVTLASDAISDLQNKIDFNKFYGKGSYYDKMQQALVAKGLSEAEIAKEMAKYWSDPAHFQAAYADYQKTTSPTAQTTSPLITTAAPTLLSNAANVKDNYVSTIPKEDIESAVTKVIGNLTDKKLSKANWFKLVNQLREDGQGGKRLTSDVYSELEKAGYLPPKDIY